MIEDKVMYAELRPTFLPHQDYETIETIVIEVRESLKAKKNELGKRNEGNRFPFGLKLIYCTPRSIEKDEMSRQLSYCIKLKESHGDLICGKLTSLTLLLPLTPARI
jgi:adenosine deaminase CECR1